jgi:hypothetical protein
MAILLGDWKFYAVKPGLDPGIHVLLTLASRKQDVDGRDI